MILPGTGRGTAPAGRGGGGSQSLARVSTTAARKLRRSMLLPEVLLWQQLRGQKLGFKVRRQHPVGPYVADFYVSERRLIIEVDGDHHGFKKEVAHDSGRDKFMVENGYGVCRIRAVDVLKRFEAVIEMIIARVAIPLHHPADGPPPRVGEE
ncbi:MAG: endonuclease domain-containing protein [Sphingomicrobium sp.]|nr:endonuclease domain-containing protein [Sphingomonadales bacterium]